MRDAIGGGCVNAHAGGDGYVGGYADDGAHGYVGEDGYVDTNADLV